MMDLPLFIEHAQACAPAIEAVTLAKIAKQESALRPWALSVNYPNGTARKLGEPGGYARLQKQPSSKDQALRWAKRLIEQGHTVSFGLMQISSQNLARLGYTLEQAYEPCTNIKIAGTLLSQKLASAKTLAPDNPLPVALSLYNSGDMRMGFANGYVSGVLGQVVKPDSLRVDSAGASVGKIALEAATPSPVRTEAAAPVKGATASRAIAVRSSLPRAEPVQDSRLAALAAPTRIEWVKP